MVLLVFYLLYLYFFLLIVIYDSMGIRYESGNQARVINKVVGTNLKRKN